MTRFVSPVRPLGVALLLFVAAGCGNSKSDVTGAVTYNGKPLASGSVTFYSGDKAAPVVAAIGPGGKYTAKGVATGPVKAAVYSPDPRIEEREIAARAGDKPESAPAGPQADRKAWFPIPDKYADPAKSGLEYTLKGGSNDINIEIKDGK